ncbi:MAG: CHAT domain-containing protein [Acidobacteria bacterium]|nr:CHAT domain-containing protein [Acidobacteriota bacterium]
MPRLPGDLRSNFVVVNPATTIGELRRVARARNDPDLLVVVDLGDGRYALLELRAILEPDRPHDGDARLSDLFDCRRFVVATVDADPALARAGARGQPVVVLERATVRGILFPRRRSLERLPDAPAAPAPPEPQAPGTGKARWINAEIEGIAPGAPLAVGRRYELTFDVDVEERAGSLVRGAEFRARPAPGQDTIALDVLLAGEHVEIEGGPQRLEVPRSGPSPDRARFGIVPRREGPVLLHAVFLRAGNLVQVVTLELQVGAAGRTALRRLGRAVEDAFALAPRELGLTILDEGSSYRMILAGPVAASATVPLTFPQLGRIVEQARAALHEVVHAVHTGAHVFQDALAIPAAARDAALAALARAGFRLFQQVFAPPGGGSDLRLLGDRLRAAAARGPLRLQVFAQRFPVPWGLLYLAERFDPARVDPELFLGLGHVVEQIPLQQDMHVLDGEIAAAPALSVGLNVNADLDAEMRLPLVGPQLGYWDDLARAGRARVSVRRTRDDVSGALARAAGNDAQIEYFFCHAESRDLTDPGGPDASSLVLTGRERLTLEDLNLLAPASEPFAGSPLVFLNACASARLSPLFYDGFVPYFVAKGARGVIGTECDVPAVFAAAWARAFFDRFLAGEGLGRACLALRREFLFEHGNPLGLLYAVYCDAETRIVRAPEPAAVREEGRIDA